MREALAVELAKNWHAVDASPGDLVVAADVEDYWLDAARRRAATQYVGRVAIALAVVDAHSGGRLLTRRYVGIKQREADADAEGAWREVMDAVLARATRDVATDPDLAAALAHR